MQKIALKNPRTQRDFVLLNLIQYDIIQSFTSLLALYNIH